ncbi:tRNA (adenosine(37)-N6)-threonylcarbamoyltransferase complex dimerization subunit type 1 TsaB [Leptospira noguchii]|uniref:tRNA (adenosine(37)-N6)-threonylcarbamoyltransferase complex dimerization subunit type 1 TsaB n=1 Tax=Leptospira noguchii TaxID=28182 RepID=UPI001F066AA9|nr:tRNA (adenosine(37)-N6)-threonylcarbamoyltransferase complex dimerization subunit type 1 TsaB [Leptospira noguchii]MCH1911092.1 tRNA (adenosine(37)-N6)-threonylcarbamoyltransferase complex dimerization subunit type 1 TsaB [Leptospira noguchii]MCH1914116.1 tRNA (adenosine(37)-N6)-threonylcarbamoyltransferase complex dimerization subunit type 1 TsaB [Leptospira noguchii]UOG64122.1 tRNA (adenosine(37)-N6)-threonylcarbamoyltransferase complex dimerization subunit type 1 TsaB [Leptospira noguchii]
MKKILFFDATNQWILVESFRLSSDGQLEIIASYSGIHPRESSKLLIQELKNVLQKSDWKTPDLIVSALGPGSFTGLRIAVATARNLSQLWKIPAIGFDSLNVYASFYYQEVGDPVIVGIEAKQKKIYFGMEDNRGFFGSIDVKPEDIINKIPEDRLQTFLTSQKYSDHPNIFSGNSILENLPSASALLNQNINLIQEALNFPDQFPYWKLVPNYVRGTYVDDKLTI